MNTTRHANWMLLCVAAALSFGCAAPSHFDPEFGDSVRHMVDNQIYDPDAALNPPPEPPTQTDAQYGESYLQVYRTFVGDPREIKKDMPVKTDEDE